jgi:hypothetical protein
MLYLAIELAERSPSPQPSPRKRGEGAHLREAQDMRILSVFAGTEKTASRDMRSRTRDGSCRAAEPVQHLLRKASAPAFG